MSTPTGLVVYVDDVDASCYVLPPVTVTWGRESPGDGLEPRRVSATFLPEAEVRRGSRLRVLLNAPASDPRWMDAVGTWAAQGTKTWAGARVVLAVFQGTVTDTSTTWEPVVPHEEWECRVEALAVDPLGDLANLYVGDTTWPQETVTQRAQRIQALTPLTWSNDVAATTIAARDVDSQAALGLLDELTSWASLAGGVFFDPITSTALFLLDANRQTTTPAVTISGCDVTTDASLEESAADVVNDVTVTYVNPADLNARPEVHEVAATSVQEFGRRHLTISTELISSTDATTRAQGHVKRYGRSLPRWANLTLRSTLDPARTTAELLMKARPGLRVRIDEEVPPPAVLPWDGYLEGWQLSGGPEEWELVVMLSPAAWSGPLLAWNASSLVGKRWVDVHPSWRWVDAVTEVRWVA